MPIYKRGDTWWVRLQINGERIAFSAGNGATAEQAKALEAQTRQAAVKGRLKQSVHTLEDAAVRWLEGEARGLKDHRNLIGNIRLIRPYLDCDIRHAQVAAQKIREAWPDLTPATINRRLAIVRRLVNLAWQWGWIDHPVKITLQPGERARHVYLTIPEVIRLAKRAGQAKWHVILAAFTGARTGELLNLKPADVVGDMLILHKTKNSKPRVVPLNAPARCAIERLDWEMRYDRLWHCFDKARGGTDLRFHDLRHTAASFMVKGGASMVAVRDILGHSNLGVTSRYSHLAVDELKKAVDKMTNGTKTVQTRKR